MAKKTTKEGGAPRTPAPPPPPSAPSLDDVIIALQKSFSRVSARSADVPAENARAMVVGQISFDLSLRANPDDDKLRLDSRGAIELKFSGTLDTDVRTVDMEKGQETPPGPGS